MLDAASLRASASADAHGIDRAATWIAVVAAVAAVALAWAGRDALGRAFDTGDLWILAALTLAIGALAAALVTRYLAATRDLADIARHLSSGAAGHTAASHDVAIAARQLAGAVNRVTQAAGGIPG